MTQAHFPKALELVLQHETGGDPTGAYTKDPLDHGGETKWGVTQRTLEGWRKTHPAEAPPLIYDLTRDQATTIYRELYWRPMGLDLIDDQGLCAVVFDQAVLGGVGTAAMRLQRLVGVFADGTVGPATVAAVMGKGYAVERPPHMLAFNFIRASSEHYLAIVKADPPQLRFFAGWTARLFSCLDFVFFRSE